MDQNDISQLIKDGTITVTTTDMVQTEFDYEITSVKVKKLEEDAVIPKKNNSTDAGYDIHAAENKRIYNNTRELIKTNISMAIPNGYVGLIWPRSGLAVKQGVDILAGVIDSGYRGEICVVLQNHGSKSVDVRKGDRIAQLLIQKVENFTLLESNSLDDSDRGASGFGSSGAQLCQIIEYFMLVRLQA